ncbi:hypothetical protein WME94_53110 [Sorangium sp. So ce429]
MPGDRVKLIAQAAASGGATGEEKAPEDEAWFRKQWARSGKKLDRGKSCVRFKKLEDLPLDVIGQTIKRVPARQFIEYYENATRGMRKGSAKGGGR